MTCNLIDTINQTEDECVHLLRVVQLRDANVMKMLAEWYQWTHGILIVRVQNDLQTDLYQYNDRRFDDDALEKPSGVIVSRLLGGKWQIRCIEQKQ